MKQERLVPKTRFSGQHAYGHTAGDAQQDMDVSWGRDKLSLWLPCIFRSEPTFGSQEKHQSGAGSSCSSPKKGHNLRATSPQCLPTSPRETPPHGKAQISAFISTAGFSAGQKTAFPGRVLPKLGSAHWHGVFFKKLNPQTLCECPTRREQCPAASQGSGHMAVIQPPPSAPSARKHSAELAGKALLSAKPPREGGAVK